MTLTETQISAYAELIEACKQRAHTYNLLSRLYEKEVDDELLRQLKASKYPANTGSQQIDHGNYLVAKYLSNTHEFTLTELARDYAHIFLGNGMDSFSAAYPSESVYTSEERLTMQDSRDEVRKLLRQFGFQKADTWTEPDDHIALELGFQAILAQRCAKLLEENKLDETLEVFKKSSRFLQEHILPWMPPFMFEIRRRARTDFYQGIALETEGFLQTETEFFGELFQS
jgi:TorA maturation chaperone TorD